VITKVAPPAPPELKVVAPELPAPSPAAEAKPTPPTDSQLQEQRHRLASRRDALERERGRLAEGALTDPALRAQLDKLGEAQAAVDADLQQINAALIARLAEQPDNTTGAFIEWSAASGGLRFSDRSPAANPNWPRLP
jgi:type IV secretory pathway VirB10-like protein